MTSTLAAHVNATAIITQYQATCADIRKHFAGLVESEKRLNLALGVGYREHGIVDHGGISISADRNQASRFDEPDRAIKFLRKNVWDAIVERLELRKFLSIGKWNELQKLIDDDEMPEITHESVGQFVAGLVDMRKDLLADAVKEVFNKLRPWRSEHKSNSQEEIGPKVVMTWMVEANHMGGLRVRYGSEQELLAMERVFQMLDGKGEISKAHYSEIDIAMRAGARRGETPYFAWRAFGNSNLHVRFRRLDLLGKFNQIAGGKNLRKAKPHSVAAADAMEVAS